MGQQEQAQPNEPDRGPRFNEVEPGDKEDAPGVDVPSTEEEIDPGINQDVSSAQNFSSEPSDEAAGEK